MEALLTAGCNLFHLFTPITTQTPRVNNADNLRTNIKFSFNLRQMHRYVYSFILSQPGGPCSFLCHPLNMFSSSAVAEVREVMEEDARDEVSSDNELSLE